MKTANSNWSDYLYFLKVAEFRNLQQSAKALGVNSSTVYRRLNALEEKLNVKLFDRSRSQQGYDITIAGERMLEKLKEVEALFNIIEEYFTTEEQEIYGHIKIGTSDGIGEFWLLPYIALFKKEYPQICIEMMSINRNDRLDEKDIDFSLVMAHQPLEYMESKKIQNISLALYASKDSIKQLKATLKKGEKLEEKIDTISPGYDLHQFKAINWFCNFYGDEKCCLKGDGFVNLYHYCCQGLGATMLPDYIGDNDKNLQKIKALPKELSVYMWLLTHPHKKLTAVSRLFIKFFVQKLLM